MHATLRTAQILAAAAALLGSLAQAHAAPSIRVQCEQRPDRAVVSVDGKGLGRANYSASVNSGGNMASAPGKPSVNGEVEFDFSSQPNDITAGAVAIAPSFIVNGSVTGRVSDASGNTVVSDTVACRVRR